MNMIFVGAQHAVPGIIKGLSQLTGLATRSSRMNKELQALSNFPAYYTLWNVSTPNNTSRNALLERIPFANDGLSF
jgi:hypothetical protein